MHKLLIKCFIFLVIFSHIFSLHTYANNMISRNEYRSKVLVEDIAKEFNQDAYIIYAIMKLESETTFDPNLVCYNKNSKDKGLMQINSKYEMSFKEGCEKYREQSFNAYSAFNPRDNITLGTYIFWTTSLYAKELSLKERLTIYNGGYGYLLKYGINYDYVNAVLQYRHDYKPISINQRR